jgi:hypothetical protein
MSIRPHHVHVIGCALVVIGFLWLAAVQLSIKPLGKAVMSKHYASVERTGQYTGQEVRKIVDVAVEEMVDRIPPIALPGVVMLGGSILLASAARKSKNPD